MADLETRVNELENKIAVLERKVAEHKHFDLPHVDIHKLEAEAKGGIETFKAWVSANPLMAVGITAAVVIVLGLLFG